MSEQQFPKKFKISTLGCRTNQYESQAFRDQFIALGMVEAAPHEEADYCVVNTCTVTESADSASRHEVRHLMKNNPKAKLAVTGCLADRKPEAIHSIGNIDIVLNNSKKEEAVKTLLAHENIENFPEFSIKNFENHTRAFVKVQDGCNSYCTYCIIPYVRGRSRSRTVDQVLDEVKALIDNGYKEVVITGINVGDFDGAEEKPVRLAELISKVDSVNGLHRLRVSSIDPDEIDDELMDVILNGKTTCHSMHVVLQSGSNVILKRMNRKYTRQIFLDTVNTLKSKDPHFTFTTDVIVGFPGETESDFQETVNVIETVHFAKVHMFPYSPRERTRAFLYPQKIDAETMRKRKHIILEKAEEIAFTLRQKYVGETVEILTERSDVSDKLFGHTANFLPVWVNPVSDSRGMHKDLLPNQLIKVKLTENSALGLLGNIVS